MTNLRHQLLASIAAEDGRAVAYSAKEYAAFRVCELGDGHRTYPMGPVAATTLPDALNETMVLCTHKEMLVIRETGDGQVLLHLYSIKRRSAPDYTFRDHAYHREHRLYAAHVCTIDGGVIAL